MSLHYNKGIYLLNKNLFPNNQSELNVWLNWWKMNYPHQKINFSFIDQNISLFPHLNLVENVLFESQMSWSEKPNIKTLLSSVHKNELDFLSPLIRTVADWKTSTHELVAEEKFIISLIKGFLSQSSNLVVNLPRNCESWNSQSTLKEVLFSTLTSKTPKNIYVLTYGQELFKEKQHLTQIIDPLNFPKLKLAV